ncbi:hypothetical protein KQ878_02545 [Mycoplasma zalophidermidis]|uniref:Uncharacterized protein n=1 Tax=Mycoplasma zalophidermidis TaxID=398174 RepID=A0ABS6DTD5_9MOLU|nr:hypothetical protein [Mycoplasma zalophidermidis]MBU4693753.1 hypothetical protein [Mycoplasma zalophidermidis]
MVTINKNEFKNIEKLIKVITDADDTKKKIDSITGEDSKKLKIILIQLKMKSMMLKTKLKKL